MQANNSPAPARPDATGRRAVRRVKASARLGNLRASLAAVLIAFSAASTAAVDPAALDQGSDIAYRRALAPAATARKLNADADVAARVRRIVNRLVAAAGVNPATRTYAWSINVVADPSPAIVVYPGGRMLVHDSFATATGLSDEEFAAIAAHAIAHSMLGHDAARIAARAGPAAEAAADPNRRALALADATVEVVRTIRYTPEENTAADRMMVELMSRAAYDPRAAGSAWRRARDFRPIVERSPVSEQRLAAIDAAARESIPLYDETRERAAAQAPTTRRPPGAGPGRAPPR